MGRLCLNTTGEWQPWDRSRRKQVRGRNIRAKDNNNDVPFILDSQRRVLEYDENLSQYRATLKRCSSKKRGSWRLALIDGPRGLELLQVSAEVASDDDSHDDDGYDNNFIPHAALRHMSGFLYVVGKITETTRSGRLPTTENVTAEVYGGYESWEYRGPAKKYFENGGRVEHAIDALLRTAQVSVEDGEFYEILE